MSTRQPSSAAQILEGPRPKVAVVTAEWNDVFTAELERQAVTRLKQLDCDVDTYSVPGTMELPYAASRLAGTDPDLEAVMVIGCVVRGDTPHFDYVCKGVTEGITAVNAEGDVPVIFGVLTVDNDDQASRRVNDDHKGVEWADALVKMIAFRRATSY